ncbi:TolQ protein [uncultured Selenomonas sp.]|uniref:TolQ protein n=1 Tax=uncultured Selenomonas sp. TaxID=159275 RepID=UPI0028DAFB31|nr:TolQ protein [uncultured Selenomonas sp.]
MSPKRLGEGGFLAAEAAMLMFLLLFAVASLAALERSASLLAHSEAETSALFLAEGELASMERRAAQCPSGTPLPVGQRREAEENGRRFSLEAQFFSIEASSSVCRASVQVSWMEGKEARELSLERTVHLGGGR